MAKARADLLSKLAAGGSSTAEVTSGVCSGRFLLATPGMMDERFDRSVIYLCTHSDEGAMGIVINHPATDLTFSSIVQQLDLPQSDSPTLPKRQLDEIRVFRGGPVEPGRGFVLHSGDIVLDQGSLKIGDDLYLTTTINILRLISIGQGPQEALFALGYAGWAPGQLEQELQGDGWLTCDLDRSLLFDKQPETKYQRVLGRIGIDLAQFSSVSGHA